jgi:hypothetical protein
MPAVVISSELPVATKGAIMNRYRQSVLMFGAFVLVVNILLSTCGGSCDKEASTATASTMSTSSPTTGTATSSPQTGRPTDASPGSGSPTGDTAALESETLGVTQAIQQRDRDRLQDVLGDQARERARDQDFQRLRDCVPDGATMTLLNRTVSITGDTATVTVTLQMPTFDGQTMTEDRVWTFQQQPNGTWKLTEFPDCPFQQ